MSRIVVGFVFAGLVALVIGCGGSVEGPHSTLLRTYSCDGTGTPPPQKLIVPRGNPISGSWNAVLVEAVTDLPGTAGALAAKYGGQVRATFPSIKAFNISLADDKAALLSLESVVCYVEQDAYVTAATRSNP